MFAAHDDFWGTRAQFDLDRGTTKSHRSDAVPPSHTVSERFSKELDNFKAAVALHFAYHKFVKIDSSVRVTPAMALGVSSRL
jgi:hypothetical protein